ncbi:MAG: CoA transferase [Nitriliruptorales bacterium]|nr:CoA transferase [Nitriliruptorales bacterium]
MTEAAPAGDRLPLTGVTVIDCSQLVAGPMVGMLLADFGADVIKIEHPATGDPLRAFGKSRNGVGLYSKFLHRNKRPVNLALNRPAGQDLFVRLLETTRADVVIEAFRPGTLERWNLGYDRLAAANPGVVVVRISGFGQTGPYRDRPGFGTLAEAMSGFAHMTGQPDGPPTLPPIPLADSIAALYSALGVVLALRARDASPDGRGQVVDTALLEGLFSFHGNQLLEFDQLGEIAQRHGNRAPTSSPRNLYRTADDRWVAIAGSADSVAGRLFTAMGRTDLNEHPHFVNNTARLAHADEVDEVVAQWVAGIKRDDLLALLVAAHVPVAPVADMADLSDDPHLAARGAIAEVPDDELGPLRMPGVLPRLSHTPGVIRHAGSPQGSATAEIYGGLLGLDESEIARLRADGIV